ncbi:MAG: hypothetical protein HYY37_06340 [Candidatus Aenigmarchaeota archaeon]|nr:hypothetical protein [Candidatus Aenigmarchaeota archaeon]
MVQYASMGDFRTSVGIGNPVQARKFIGEKSNVYGELVERRPSALLVPVQGGFELTFQGQVIDRVAEPYLTAEVVRGHQEVHVNLRWEAAGTESVYLGRV